MDLVRKNMVSSWKGHHDYLQILGDFKGKPAENVAPCGRAEYGCRSIAKGLTSKTGGILSKTSLGLLRLVDLAADAGDRDAVRLVGILGLVAGVGGAVLMPPSTLWLQVVVYARLLRDSRLVVEQRARGIESVG